MLGFLTGVQLKFLKQNSEAKMNIDLNLLSAMTHNSNSPVGLTVLKKSMDLQSQNVQMLLSAIPQPPNSAANLPPNLGQNINTTA
jgi:hypothetical protein